MKKPISIVIASLGGPELKSTLDSIYNQSIAPSEIIIVIPEECKVSIEISKLNAIRIINSKFKGQVIQRIIGFKEAAYEYVLQMDDDIQLEVSALELLYEQILLCDKNVTLAPMYYNINTKNPLYNIPYKKLNFLQKYLFGFKDANKLYGKLTLCGTSYGVNPNYIDGKLIKVEWLPGGCIMHRRENLILESYFPYKGKAYCEDLIHSYYMVKKSNLKLFVVTESKIYLDPPIIPKEFKELIKEFKARFLYSRISKCSIHRTIIWSVLSYVKRFLS